MRAFLRLIALAVLVSLAVQTPQAASLALSLNATIWPVAEASVTQTEDISPLSTITQSVQYEPPPKSGFQQISFVHDGQDRQIWLFPKPVGADITALPPLVILLHGSGRDGRAMLDMWQQIAASGAVVAAPDALDAAAWDRDDDGEAFLTAVVTQVAKIHAFDPEKISLYGHSSGANMALYVGNCTAFPARAIAVHAGIFHGCFRWGPAVGHRYLIQIGDHDAIFPLDAVRASAERLAASGSPVELQIIRDHDHWFYDLGPSLAAQAWRFFNAPVDPALLR